jgi:cellobiose-specific phosphotransferase system component IIB
VNHKHLNTIAILGTDTLAEGILARLLEREGYATTIIEAYPTGLVEELLDDVDILLVAPGLKDGVREGFLEAMRNAPKTAIPVLPLSAALKQALLDEVSVSLCWRVLLKELVQELEYALARGAVASTEALAVDNDEVV